MKRRFRAVFACLIVLLSAAYGAAAQTLALPDELKIIEQEAFQGTTAIDQVILPDGTAEIRARAFAGSGLLALNLPDSVEFIAEDAFEDCANLTVTVPRGSYAHRFAAERDMKYVIEEPDEPDSADAGYTIRSAEYTCEAPEDGEEGAAYFLIEADTAEACIAQVALYDEDDEDGEPLLKLEAPADAQLSGGQIRIGEETDFAVPQYYVLKAKLLRSSDAQQLGETFVSYAHTRRRESVMSKTPEEYAGREVISYGEAGYAVLAQGVIRIGDAQQSGSGYTFDAPQVVSVGDVLMLSVEGKDQPVKVASVEQHEDGSVTVQPDSGICMADVFDRVEIGGYMQAEPGGGLSGAAASAAEAKVIELDPGFSYGPAEVSGELKVSVMLDFVFDKEADYTSVEFWIDNQGKVEVSLTAGFDTRDFKVNPLQIPLYNAPITIPGTDIGAQLTVSIPLDVDLEVGGSAYVSFEAKTGYTYNSDEDVLREIRSKDGEAYAMVKGEVTATVGPQILVKAELMEFLEAEIRGQIGLEVKGEVEGLQYGGSVSDEPKRSRHACGGCLNCDANFFAGIWGTLEGNISEKISIDLLDSELFVIRAKVGDAYWSFLNDEHSPYGGEESHAFTECENVQYYTEVITLDYADEEAVDIPIAIDGEYGTHIEGLSPMERYLYPGTASFAAAFETGVYAEEVKIEKDWNVVILEEPDVTLTVTAVDDETYKPIRGASLTLTLPDGTRRTALADAGGRCVFENLPAGTYSLTASATNYENKTYTGLEYEGGYQASFTAALSFNGELPYIYAEYVYSGRHELRPREGSIPDGLPRTWLSVENKGTDHYLLRVENEDCETDYVCEYLDMGFTHANMIAMDMGEHEYVYVLSVTREVPTDFYTYSVYKEYHTIMRVEDGRLKTIASFNDLDSALFSTYCVDAEFISKNECVGTMYPSGRAFKVTTKTSNTSRIGCALECDNTGYLYAKKNADGYYDLEYAVSYRWMTTKRNSFGSLYSRFVMQDGEIVFDSQWYQCNPVDTVTYP